jgi:NAD(P)H-dependent FMN reductase
MKGRLFRRASLSIGALLGNLEEGSFTRDFERWIKDVLNGGCVSL